jgi:hypothetical protein
MQISGVSLTLTWPRRLYLLRVLLCMSHCYKLSPLQALGKVTLHWLSLAACLFTFHVASRPSPLSCGVFLPLPLLQAFRLLIAWRVPPLLLPSLAGLFIYSSVRDFPSPPLLLRVPRPLCYVSFLLLLLIIQFFFLFSLGGGVSLSRGLCDLAQDCLWE